MIHLIDYAGTPPSATAIAACGYRGVIRYLSHTPSKNLSASERDRLLAAGLSISLVWETTANRASQGIDAGRVDAMDAFGQASQLGYPAGCPIFYAVDYDADPDAVLPYFQGAAQVSTTYPVGVYGGIRVVDELLQHGVCTYGWQTVAWSHGQISQLAHLYQRLKPTIGCPQLGDYDEDLLLKPFPLWGDTDMTKEEHDALVRCDADTDALIGLTPRDGDSQLSRRLDRIEAKVNELGGGGASGALSEADVNRIATKTADLLAARLQS